MEGQSTPSLEHAEVTLQPKTKSFNSSDDKPLLRATNAEVLHSSKKPTGTTPLKQMNTSEIVPAGISTFTEYPSSGNQPVEPDSDTIHPGSQGETRIDSEISPSFQKVQSRQSSQLALSSVVPPRPLINEQGEFVVVGDNRAITRHNMLFDAMRELKRHTRGSRCIFEVRDKHVLLNPHKIAGFMQTRGNDFNNEWNDVDDIRRLHRIAALWYSANHKPKPVVKGQFIVVVDRAVVRFCRRLQPAISELRKHDRETCRCIFEVADRTVLRNMGTIAGYRQTTDNGFDKHWNDNNDIERMYGTACVWYARMKLPGQYIAVVKRTARFFDRLYKAQNMLWRAGSGDRCIFEVKNGKVVEDPMVIAGIAQRRTNGFNVHWGDVEKLQRVAFLKYARRYIHIENVKAGYFVVTDKGVRRCRRLRTAMRAVRRHRDDDSPRCIFVTRNGRVQCKPNVIMGYRQSPAMGFDSHWTSTDDMFDMYVEASNWRKKPYFPKDKKGTFVVIVKDVLIDKYDSLLAAQCSLRCRSREEDRRVIFQVRKGKVIRNPNKIAGYPQTSAYGFDPKWKDDEELTEMYNVAVKEAEKYIVVVGDTVEEPFYKLQDAQNKLQEYPSDLSELRGIFVIRFHDLSHVPLPGERLRDEDKDKMAGIIKKYFIPKREQQMKGFKRAIRRVP